MNKGIDVSDNQGVIDWVKVKEDGVKYAVLRSIRHSGKVDHQFQNNVAGCRNVNLPFDVYKYSYAKTTAEAIREAAAVVKILKDNQIQCMVWWDMEDKSLEGLGKNVLTQLINAAKMIVETAGFPFGVYCNLNWYNNVLDTANYTVPFWVARYPSKNYMDILENPNEEKKPQIKQPLFGWQYTDKGMVNGIKGNVDLNILYSELKEETKMNKPLDYKQYDTKWGTNKYATPQESSTIKSAGCGPTAVANVLAAIVNVAINPLTCASWARMKGYKYTNQGTSYDFPEAIGKEYGVIIKRLNTASVYGNKSAAVHQEALEELQKGNWLIACMGKGIWTSSGHYITVYGCEKGNVYINDPASTAKNRAKNKWTTFISQVKYYWVVEVPEAIRLRGNTQVWRYDFADFVREVQMTIGDNIDGNADAESLTRTVTINPAKKVNIRHNAVLPLQKLFKQLGYYTGALDRVAGIKFQSAINEYQKNILGAERQDGEITRAQSMWKRMLKI